MPRIKSRPRKLIEYSPAPILQQKDMLSKLPQELLEKIIGDLTLVDIGNLRACNKELDYRLCHLPTMNDFLFTEKQVWVYAEEYARLVCEDQDWYCEEERESEEFDMACNYFQFYRSYVPEMPTLDEYRYWMNNVKRDLPLRVLFS